MVTAHLYPSRIRHVRTRDPRRSFTHRSYLWLVDIDRLPQLPRWLAPLARFEARDHLGDPNTSIRANVDRILADHHIALDGGRILMLTNARVLGYVFNPLTLYWCHHADGSLACVIAEVHNTYRQCHTYMLRTDPHHRTETTKKFFVSPFLPARGRYRMYLPPPGRRLAIGVVLEDDNADLRLVASVHGHRLTATTANLLRTALRHPLAPLVTSVMIRWHGLRLALLGAPAHPCPRRSR